MNKLKETLFGFVIGVSMLIPGVSGGSIAVLLGIYDRLLAAVAGLVGNFKIHFGFVFRLCMGAGVGFLSMAGFVRLLLERHYMPTLYFFLGVVIGGVGLYALDTLHRYRRISYTLTLIGIIFVLLTEWVPANLFGVHGLPVWLQFILYILLGVILAIALILPGISFSLMLVILGMYDRFIQAVEQMDFRFLAPLGCCILFGVIVCTKGLHWFMKKKPMECCSLIFGFVLASVYRMFPGMPEGGRGWMCYLLCILGIAIPIGVSVLLKKRG